MGSDTLVYTLIEDGRRLTSQLVEEGNDIAAACWVKSAEDQPWTLYISTQLTDRLGPLRAYRVVHRVLRSLGETSLSASDIVLIGERHPMTGDVLSILRSHSGISPTRSKRPLLGGAPIEEVYVYPKPRQLAHTELNDQQKQVLVELYNGNPLAVDDLAYTEEMERIHQAFVKQTGLTLTVRDVFKALKNLGRKGRLSGKAGPHPSPETAGALSSPQGTVPEAAGDQ